MLTKIVLFLSWIAVAVASLSSLPSKFTSDPILNELRSRFVSQQILGVASTVLEAESLDNDVTFFVSQFNVDNSTFIDIDYASSSAASWPSANHTIRVRLFLSAVLSPLSRFYNDSSVKSIAFSALSWWIKHDPTSSNWWDNDISTPLNIGAATLLLSPAGLSLSPAQLDVVVNVILSRASVTDPGTSTGANLLWQGTAIVMRGLLEDNQTLVEHALNASYAGIGVSSAFKDGIQSDGSFFQHGQQIYSGGYGAFYTQTVLALLNLTTGTPLALIDTLRLNDFANFLVDGELRTIYYAPPELGGASFDISVCGRGITRPYVGHLSNIGLESGMRLPFTASMLKAWGASILSRKEEIEAFADLIEFGANSSNASSLIQVKSRVFFMADYGVHARPNWMSTVRLHSNRLLGSECVNDEGKLSGHLADGANYLYRSGREYGDRVNGTLVFPAYDWQRIPGTTVKVGALKLDCEDVSGVFGIRSFAGGVSDGSSSHLIMSVDWEAPQKQGLFARKSWSFFEDLYVALGSNISSVAEKGNENATAVVVTTVDQRLLDQEGGVFSSESATTPLPLNDGTLPLDSNVWWLWHDRVGYIIPTGDLRGGANIYMSNNMRRGDYSNIGAFSGNVTLPVFTLWLQHNLINNGAFDNALLPPHHHPFSSSLSSSSSSYAYIVVPDVELNVFSTTAATILSDLVISRSVESHAVLLQSEGALMFTVFDEVPKNGYLNVSTENDGFPEGWRAAVGGGPTTGIMKLENGGMSKRREGGGGEGMVAQKGAVENTPEIESNVTASGMIEFSLSDPSHATPARTVLISVDRSFTPSRIGEGMSCGSDAPVGWSAEVTVGVDGSGVQLKCEEDM